MGVGSYILRMTLPEPPGPRDVDGAQWAAKQGEN